MIDLLEACEIARREFPRGPEAVASQIGAELNVSPLTGCDGWCVSSPRRTIIRLNSNSPVVRRRFTLAHELAHLLLGTETDIPSVRFHGLSNLQEEAATNEVAAQLLIPSECVETFANGMRPITAERLNELASMADVSWIMAARRVARLSAQLGLDACFVAQFCDSRVRWIWPARACRNEQALDLLLKARSAPGGMWQARNDAGVIVTAIENRTPFGDGLLVQYTSPDGD